MIHWNAIAFTLKMMAAKRRAVKKFNAHVKERDTFLATANAYVANEGDERRRLKDQYIKEELGRILLRESRK